MSTVDKFQRKRHLHPDTDLDVESDSELRLPRGKRRGMPRWPLVLLLILGGAAAVLWFLPRRWTRWRWQEKRGKILEPDAK